ncbi:MAG: HAMP domain-containing histidine kinase [Halobacteriovoraceae bacterium]|nr:HAMP domain-containing histidine kinase [Halobacteriovoraceae bacterium]
MEKFEKTVQKGASLFNRLTYLQTFHLMGACGYLSWHWVYQGLLESDYDYLWFRVAIFLLMWGLVISSLIFKKMNEFLELTMFLILCAVFAIDLLVMCRLNPGSVYQTFGMYILLSIMIISVKRNSYIYSFAVFSLLLVLLSQLHEPYLAGNVYFHMVGLGTIIFFGVFFQLEKNRYYEKAKKERYMYMQVENVSHIGGWHLDFESGKFWPSYQLQKILRLKSKEEAFSLIDLKPILGESNYNDLVKNIKKLRDELKTFEDEIQVKNSNGLIDYYKIVARPFKVEELKAESAIGTFQDVTVLKQLENELNEEKEKALLHSKLSSVGRLASGMAHEINNPLTVIKNLSRRLLREETDSRKVTLLEKNIRSVDRVAEIVQKLKSISSTDLKEGFVATDICELLENTLVVFNSNLKKYNIELNYNFQEMKCIVNTNVPYISQVIAGLIENSIEAIKGLEEKWIRIEITESTHDYHILFVDSGKGIKKDIHESIMEPFFSTKKSGHGTGLGLSSSLSIVKEHGGDLYLDSAHENTTFVLVLPKLNLV